MLRGKERYQSAPWLIVSVQAAPRDAKSAERMEGAMIAGGAIKNNEKVLCFAQRRCSNLRHRY